MLKKDKREYDLQNDLRETGAYNCLSCGRCTGNCPVSRLKPGFSPRLIVERAILGHYDNLASEGVLWNCWTCGICSHTCHLNVDFPEFVKRLRKRTLKKSNVPPHPHHSIFQSCQSLMSNTPVSERRKTNPSGNVTAPDRMLFFRGCANIFDLVLKDLDLSLLGIVDNVSAILKQTGIILSFMNEEKCCGHDKLWAGEEEDFIKLAQHAQRELKSSGAERIVTFCPECCHTLKNDYPKYLPGFNFEVIHWIELVFDSLEKGNISFASTKRTAVYLDSCKMGRYLGLYEQPRKVLNSIPDLKIVEMERNRKRSACCGVSSWVLCSSVSKINQIEIISEIKKSGADLIITTCPKCMIHLSCALREANLHNDFQVSDLSQIVLSALIREVEGEVEKNG